MNDVTLNNEIIRITIGDVEGPIGARGPVGPSGNNNELGAEEHSDTVATFQATAFDPDIHVVQILGYYTIGIGQVMVRRVMSEPAHPWKFRSADRWCSDESYSSANGGWWEGIAHLPGRFDFHAFGAPTDGVTDCLPYFEAFQDYLLSAFWGGDIYRTQGGFQLNLGPYAYLFSSSINIKIPMEIVGVGLVTWGSMRTRLLFSDLTKPGVVVNRFNTDGQTVLAPGNQIPGADNTTLRNLAIKTYNRPTPCPSMIPFAYAIWAKATSHYENVFVEGWPNHAFAVVATSGAGNAEEGNASSCNILNCSAWNCAGAGLYFRGADANASTSYNFMQTGCGWCIRDDSFLGNTHYSPISEEIPASYCANGWGQAGLVTYNGNMYAIVQKNDFDDAAQMAGAQINPPSGTTADNAYWWYITAYGEGMRGSTDVVQWGRVKYGGLVYTVVPGQEANMWTSQPDTTPAVWGAGVAPNPAVAYIDWTLGSQQVNKTGPWTGAGGVSGPYVMASHYRVGDINARSQFFNPYEEGGYPPFSHSYNVPAAWYGGFINWDHNSTPATWNASGGGWSSRGEISHRENAGAGSTAIGAYNNAGRLFSHYEPTAFPFGWSVDRVGGDLITWYNNAYRIKIETGPSTAFTFGRYVTVPYATFIGKLFVGEYDSVSRQVTSSSAMPTIGDWAQGDFVFNTAPAQSGGKVLLGWSRLTTGSGNVLNTDWSACYVTTT